MDERTYMYRNTNPEPEGEPIWEKWYPKTTDDAVLLTDEEGTENNKTLKEKILELETTISGLQETITALKKRVIEETEYTAIEAPNTEDSYTRLQINKDGTITKGTSSDGTEYEYKELALKESVDNLNTEVTQLKSDITSKVDLKAPVYLGGNSDDNFVFLEQKNGQTLVRLQLETGGALKIYRSTDGGGTFPQTETIFSGF